MDVTRTGNGRAENTSGPRAGGTRAARSDARLSGGPAVPPGSAGTGDRVTISEEGLRLLDAAANGAAESDSVPTSALSPERRAELLDRIGRGWYDRPEVRAAVVNELAGALAGDDSPSETR